MKKIKIIILAISMVMIGIGIFIACQKEIEDLDKIENQKIQKEQGQLEDFYFFQVLYNHHGVGKGKDKVCAENGSSCWLWNRTQLSPDANSYAGFSINELGIKLDAFFGFPNEFKGFGLIKATENSSGFPYTIIVDFPYELNCQDFFDTHFDLDNNTFTISEDIIEEEDSFLMEMLGITNPCKIPQGVYPIEIFNEGIRINIPVEMY